MQKYTKLTKQELFWFRLYTFLGVGIIVANIIITWNQEFNFGDVYVFAFAIFLWLLAAEVRIDATERRVSELEDQNSTNVTVNSWYSK